MYHDNKLPLLGGCVDGEGEGLSSNKLSSSGGCGSGEGEGLLLGGDGEGEGLGGEDPCKSGGGHTVSLCASGTNPRISSSFPEIILGVSILPAVHWGVAPSQDSLYSGGYIVLSIAVDSDLCFARCRRGENQVVP